MAAHLKARITRFPLIPEASKLGKGGQGATYALLSNPDFVVKLFDEHALPVESTEVEHWDSLRANVPVPTRAGYEYIYPCDVVTNDSSEVVGYLMKRVCDGATSHLLAVASKWAKVSFKLRVLKNYVASLVDLERAGIFQQDAGKNFMLNRHGTVFPIDMDSMRTPTHSTDAIKLEFAAPEVLRANLDNGIPIREIPFGPKQVQYAIALELWHLFQGEHAYRGKVNPPATRSRIEERIRDGCFPGVHPDWQISPNSRPRSAIPTPLLNKLLQIIVDGHSDESKRGTLTDLYEVLDALDTSSSVSLSPEEWDALRNGEQPPLLNPGKAVRSGTRRFKSLLSRMSNVRLPHIQRPTVRQAVVASVAMTSSYFWFFGSPFHVRQADDATFARPSYQTNYETRARLRKTHIPRPMPEVVSVVDIKPSADDVPATIRLLMEGKDVSVLSFR